MSSLPLYIYDLIGKPWSLPCDPPNSYDCWELAIAVREMLGKTTPDCRVPIHQRSERHISLMQYPDPSLWARLDAPQNGCLVGFGKPISHCGVFINHSVIHSYSHDGVIGSVQCHKLSAITRMFGLPEFWECCDA